MEEAQAHSLVQVQAQQIEDLSQLQELWQEGSKRIETLLLMAEKLSSICLKML